MLAETPVPVSKGAIESGTSYEKLSSSNPTHGSGWIVQPQPTNEGGSPASSNPTHGSGWIVQASLQTKAARTLLRIPPTAVGGSFRFGLQRKASRLRPRIPPTGSGWIVQVQPKEERTEILVFSLLLPSRRKGERSQNKGRGRLS